LSFWKRLFSADYRAAVSAEAAGQLEQAAEHYVLAGEPVEAARVHLARAERADTRAAEIDALRDALHWAGGQPTLRARIEQGLGRALLQRARDEGVATARDHQRVREAADLLMAGGDYATAGEALESIGDSQGAARAYTYGGLVERMEALLARDEAEHDRERTVRDAFANYEMHMRMGDRDAARADLEQCIAAAERTAEHRRLLDQLESHLITGGRVVLHRRQAPALTCVALPRVELGRDPLCALPLRAGGLSRRHAAIFVAGVVAGAGETSRFHLHDLGSRNGTLLGGLPVHGTVPLTGAGRFDLGEHCQIEFEVRGTPAHLFLRVTRGLDQGQRLLVAGPDEPMALDGPDNNDNGDGPDATAAGLPARLTFRRGRPFLTRAASARRLSLNGETVAHGEIQLIHGDALVIDGIEVEVA
jgi:tetratricopeptide (TPR) repeat protein